MTDISATENNTHPENQTHYGWGSIALHWIVAGLVIWLFWSGQQIEHAASREVKLPMVLTHNSVGVLLVIAALIRTFVRGAKGMAPRPPQHIVLDWLAAAVPWILLALVLVIIGSGVLTWWSADRPIIFFGLMEFPSPVSRNMDLHKLAESIHGVTSHIIVPIILLHVAGAMKHLITYRDGVFMRMIIPE